MLLTDNAGHTGAGEVPGGESIRMVLEEAHALVIGAKIGDRNRVLRSVLEQFAHRDAAGRGAQTFDQRVAIHAAAAIEAALLDLFGQFCELPVAALLGEGQQRMRVDVLGYLFFVGDRNRTNLLYRSGTDEKDSWLRLRDEETLSIPQCCALQRLHINVMASAISS